MRRVLFGLAVFGAAFAIDALPTTAQAQVYPWCGTYRNGATNCYFSTLSQCQQAISGNGGTCYRNSFYGGYGGYGDGGYGAYGGAVVVPRGRRHRRR